MTTFALVHGAWHGGWCWDLLGPELERRGHDAVAVDLPCDDVSAGVTAYRDAVCARSTASTATWSSSVTPWGSHDPAGRSRASGTGARLPLRLDSAARPQPRRPAGRGAGRVFVQGLGAEIVRDELGRSSWSSPDAAIAALYADCGSELQGWAVSCLRPQARTPNVEPCPLLVWPDVPSAYVLCREDVAVAPAWSRRAARERLGVEAIELDGGHSPFLARPAELADALVALA